MSTRVTQYIQPIFKSTAIQNTHPTLKTAATQYTLPTSRNHSSTCTQSQHLALNSSTSTSTSTDVPYQPNTHHTLKHICTSAPSANHHSPKRSSPLPKPQATTHLPYHIPSRPTHKTQTGITYQTSCTLAPQSLHTYHQHKPTFMHHANNNNQMTETTLTNTTHHTTTRTPFQQHTSQTQPNFLQITTQT